MFVSVIIPNYNHSTYLAQRIESILNQTYREFEVIILDDCSSDNSSEVINKYQGTEQISKIIYNDTNSGSPFKQWEKGILIAKGELIWIAESDDWCEHTLLEELVSGFKKNPDCVISYCQSYCILGENKIFWMSQHTNLSECISGSEYVKNYMLKNNSIFNASMVLWKKEIFQYIPRDFTSYKFCGDWLFWIELAQHGSVCISGKALNYFRKHDQDVSSDAYKNGVNFIEILNLLQYLYANRVISLAEYNSALKHQFKLFWKDKSELMF